MKIWVNAQLPPAIANWIVENFNVEAVAVRELDLRDATDPEIFAALPEQARKLLKIKSGDRLLMDIQDGPLILVPKPQNYTRQLAGLHHEIRERSGEYLRGEREAWNDSPKS